MLPATFSNKTLNQRALPLAGYLEEPGLEFGAHYSLRVTPTATLLALSPLADSFFRQASEFMIHAQSRTRNCGEIGGYNPGISSNRIMEEEKNLSGDEIEHSC